ncbi:MAG TPA: hydroxymethylpyrimidine/phosphomethylpyrimidine kinase [Kofleriaceae bacterium]|jgi:hydroxymethylpyrimidine/phosphomethylpyrimidine kinase|nr:hydroxymethylpyrimidine/phosphomethylpyrimidine kinase [Kofleriaceae bacterium]
MSEGRPGVLIVAGLDPSGGAGVIADVRVCEQHECRPVAVVTALTEQSTVEVRAANPVAASIVGDQLRMLLTDVEVAAVKLGMLGSEQIADEVARALELTAAPVVWDPVLRPTSGRVALYEGDPAHALALLDGHVTLMTPNADEAAALTGIAVDSIGGAVAAGLSLYERGMGAVLIKGGHWGSATEAIDVLVTPDGHAVLTGPRFATDGPVHGTGCALATAIACNLAAGQRLEEACRAAKAYVAALIADAGQPGRGRLAVL